MAYIDIYDVQGELRHMTFTATSKPSVFEVENKIVLIETEMDAHFAAAGVALPLVTSAQLSIAMLIATLGVAAATLRSVEMQPERVKFLQDMYDKKLSEIMKAPGILSTPTVAASLKPGYSATTKTERFTRDGHEW